MVRLLVLAPLAAFASQEEDSMLLQAKKTQVHAPPAAYVRIAAGVCDGNLEPILDRAECAAAGGATANKELHVASIDINTADRVSGCGINEDLPSGKSRVEFYGPKGSRTDCGYRGYDCICKVKHVLVTSGTCESNGFEAIADRDECAAAGALTANKELHVASIDINTADRVAGCGINEDLPSGKSRVEFYGPKGRRTDCGYRGYACVCKAPSAALLQTQKKQSAVYGYERIASGVCASAIEDRDECAAAAAGFANNELHVATIDINTADRVAGCGINENLPSGKSRVEFYGPKGTRTDCGYRGYDCICNKVVKQVTSGTCESNGFTAITDRDECAAAGGAAANNELHVATIDINTADRVAGCGMNENLPSGKSRVEFYGPKGTRTDCGYRGYACLCKA